MDDYFSAQALIVSQLMEQLPELRVVRGARDLASVREGVVTAPAAYVLYDGLDVRLGAGREQMVEQKWMVLSVVRHLQDALFGVGERQEAGPLLLRVCQTLLGWQPGPEHGALSMMNAPPPSFHDGFGFYPLRFTSRVVLRPV